MPLFKGIFQPKNLFLSWLTHHHIVTNPYEFITSMEHKNIRVVLSSNVEMLCWPVNIKVVHMTQTDHYLSLLYLKFFQKFKWDLWASDAYDSYRIPSWCFSPILLFLYSMDERLEVNYSLNELSMMVFHHNDIITYACRSKFWFALIIFLLVSSFTIVFFRAKPNPHPAIVLLNIQADSQGE